MKNKENTDPHCGSVPDDNSSMSVSFAFKVPEWFRKALNSSKTDRVGEQIDNVCSEICALWDSDLACTDQPDSAALANDNLRERVYLLGFWLDGIDCLDSAREHVRRSGRKGRRPKSDEASMFIDFLHHVFRHSSDKEEATLSSKSRPRIARELSYAFQHNIPPVLLVPFLRHTTQSKILTKQKLGTVEHWLVSCNAKTTDR